MLPEARLFPVLFELNPVGIAVADGMGRYLAVNPAYCSLFGYRPEELIGNTFRLILRPEDLHLEPLILQMALDNDHTAPRLWQARRRDGSLVRVRSSFRCLKEPGQPLRILTLLDDVTELYDSIERLQHSEARLEALVAARTRELQQSNEALQRLVQEDELTGLASRRHFVRQAEEAIAMAQAGGRALSLALLDLDHFKRVNDTLGHQAGDEVLQQVAARLREGLAGSALLARWGGEEFALVLPGSGLDTAGLCLAQMAARVGRKPLRTAAGSVVASFSGGVVEAGPGDTLDSLLARADHALYQAKRAGRDRVVAG